MITELVKLALNLFEVIGYLQQFHALTHIAINIFKPSVAQIFDVGE